MRLLNMIIQRRNLLELFFGDVRPLPDDLLFLLLEIAGLARLRNSRLSFYWIYVPPYQRRYRRRRPALM